MKFLERRSMRTWLSVLLIVTCLLTSFSFYTDTLAQEQVVDHFYILDEEGNPVMIEVRKEDLMRDFKSTGIRLFSRLRTGADAKTNVVGIVRFKSQSGLVKYTEADTNRAGYLHCKSVGDAAYIRTEEDGTVICKVSGVTIRVSPDYITGPIDFASCGEREVSYYTVADNGYLIHNYTYFSGTSLALASTRVGYKPGYMEIGVKYYSYDGHYFYTEFADMIADYQEGTYGRAVNADTPYYNYYQYMSLHTKASFAPEVYDAHVKAKTNDSVMLTTGNAFVFAQNTYTINALLMFGIAINESGWGTSSIAKTKNNLFGLDAVDFNPGESADIFPTVETCINEFAYEWMHKDYLNGTDSRYRGPHLGDKHSGINVKYASDPYWGEKAAARGYYLDTEKVDYGRYTIGIVNKKIISCYKEADASSTVIYTTDAKDGSYIYDFPVTILDVVEQNGTYFYKVASDMSLQADRNGRDNSYYDSSLDVSCYDAERDYVYVKATDIQVVFKGSGDVDIPDIEIPKEETPEEETPDVVIPEKTHEEVLQALGVKCTENYISGFSLGGDVGREIAKILALDSRIQMTVKRADGTQITSGTLASGMQVAITTSGSSVTYTVVIRGDVNGDGKLSAVDYVKVRNYLDRVTSLSGAYLQSADTSGDGTVSALDYVKLRNHLDNKSAIIQ